MKKFLFISVLAVSVLSAAGQHPEKDSATFLLHKFAQAIGKETYKLTREGNNYTYKISFKFVDRGSQVPLNAQLQTTTDMEPVSLFIKGSTSRFSTINDTIYIKGNSAKLRVDDSSYSQSIDAIHFPVGGYSPGTVQMALLKYWELHKEPSNIQMLPFGSVRISKDGRDTLLQKGRPLLLYRYIISGLVWGNELAWTDQQGNLICLITNDAEGDKLEMMLEAYEPFLPEMIKKAALQGMKLFMNVTGNAISRQKRPLVITGGNMVDVNNNSVMKNVTLVIGNGHILKIGKAGTVRFPKNAVVIHAEGKTILPGLWDMHAHFEQAEWGPAYLAAGVTTVRDCGNEFEYINAVKKAIDEGKGIGPHIIKAGIIDGPGPFGLGIVRASTKEDAIKNVLLYKKNGFKQIKIYSSVTPDIVKAICDEAHRNGLTVTGHIPNGMTLMQGVDSGMDMVNHLQYVYSAMKRKKDRSVDLADSFNMHVLDFIKEHGIVIDPTMGVFEMITRSVKDDITNMEPAFYSLPIPLQALFKNMGVPATEAESFKPFMQSLNKILKALHEKGISIVAGTDMGFPGYSLDRELELYVEAGLTPLEAIQTATVIPAHVMNEDIFSGSPEAGKNADLILVDGDPLKNIRELRKVSLVIKDGEMYDPRKLHLMVGFKN